MRKLPAKEIFLPSCTRILCPVRTAVKTPVVRAMMPCVARGSCAPWGSRPGAAQRAAVVLRPGLAAGLRAGAGFDVGVEVSEAGPMISSEASSNQTRPSEGAL